MEELKKGISRRNLLKGATLSAAGVAALGMFGCSPAGSCPRGYHRYRRNR